MIVAGANENQHPITPVINFKYKEEVEDLSIMTKLSLSISRALLLGALLILPIAASAQTPDEQAAFEREWYDVCYVKKDVPKCREMSKVYVAKYPTGTYIKNAKGIVETQELEDLWAQFQAALKDYYAVAPEVPRLEKLFSTGDAFLQRKPSTHYIIAQQALAAVGAGLSEVYKDHGRVNSYLSKGVTAFAAANTPDEKAVTQKDWTNYRDNLMAASPQFMGWSLIQSKGSPQAAYENLTIATKVRSVENPNLGWKDPLNYYLRSSIINDEYVAANKEYNALSDIDKTGEQGKAALTKINGIIDRVLAEYARVIATATKSDYKEYLAYAKGNFDPLWKFRTDAPDKAAAYLQSYVADPTIADVAVPAKAVSDVPPANMPTGTAGTVKMVGKGGAPGAAGGVDKPAAVKTKPAAKGNKRKR